MSDKTYRAAVIGLGMIGGADQVSGDALGQKVSGMDGTHTYAYQNHPRIDLIAGSSRDPGRRERYETRTGAKTYADWQDMIAQESLDIVSVATYTPVHAEITIACAEAGIPVIYCEKPAATTVPDAEHMLEACQSRDALLVFNHQRRFRQDHRKLRKHILADNLGELTSISLQWATGRLSNVGSHVIDALFMLTGRRVQAVSATLDLTGRPDCRGPEFRDPGCWGVMRMDNDLMVTVNAPDNAQSPFRTEINGSKGRAIVGASTVTLETWNGQTETWSPDDKTPSSMDRAADEIVAWLDNRTPFPYDPEEAVHTLEAIVAFHASHARNAAWTDLPLSGTDRDIVVLSG
ncbi:MAG: Gfo/Idh/MocA family oxidoreductase [bacterium]|nr:Gfo/Idh/MocA family oxidoreductase [bacterium]